MASRSRPYLPDDAAPRSISAAPARRASCPEHASVPSLPPSSKRIDLGANQIDIHFRATRLGALSDVAATSPPSAADNETQTLSVPGRLRRCGREIKMIDETNPFAAAKPDRRLIKLLIQARRFNTALVGSDGTPFGRAGQAGRRQPVLFHAAALLSILPPKKEDFRAAGPAYRRDAPGAVRRAADTAPRRGRGDRASEKRGFSGI